LFGFLEGRPPNQEHAVEKSTSLRIAERMFLMRRFEEKLLDLGQRKLVPGTFHVYIGQEAVGAGVIEALRPDDRILTNHRNHGHIIGRGADPGRALAEILGRSTGLCGGKGGSFHLCDVSHGFLQTSAILGGAVSLALGAAYGLKCQGAPGIAVAFFGDASLEEGVAAEAMNVAAIHKLPVLFVLENNDLGSVGYSLQGTASNTAIGSFLDIPRLYGIEAIRLIDPDVPTMAEATRTAIARAGAGDGPTFIEAVIYRWPGLNDHQQRLVTGAMDLRMAWARQVLGGEHAGWIAERDPVLRFAREAVADGSVDQAALLALDQRARTRIDEAETFALASPFPGEEALYADVFS
jgi:pyruvate dehydrogenase E1 component alpha subunit